MFGFLSSRLVVFIYFVGFFGCEFYLVNWYDTKQSTSYRTRLQVNKPEFQKPIVLFWTKFWLDEFNLSSIFYTHSECPYSCLFTHNKSHVKDAAIRILHQRDFESWPPLNPTALNAFLIMESPENAKIYGDSMFNENFFNVTISYRSSSTIYLPYNEFVLRDGSESLDQIWTSKQVEKAVSMKKKEVFAAISNCVAVTSGRKEYIEELSKHINVTKVDEHYFTLAFENSICPEYTTEKYWRLKELVVPVVLSRSVLNPNQVLDGTFIAASDFESPRELAEFLQTLIKDKQEYMKYFEWTKKYRRTMNGDTLNGIAVSNTNAGCQLCRLATLRPKLPTQNIHSFWNQSECIHDYGTELINQTDYYKQSEVQMTELVKRTAQNRSAHGNLLK
ncbi:Fucosyl transferase [Aphelenchoides besseyi]|nr:Fucosyl transferase [Aphelenchoides besseyi]